MNMPDLMDMKFNLTHQYLNSHFNRLMKNNKYIGPYAAKTWQRLTMKNQEIELDQPETYADKQIENQSRQSAEIEPPRSGPPKNGSWDADPPNPDMMRRVTRSG